MPPARTPSMRRNTGIRKGSKSCSWVQIPSTRSVGRTPTTSPSPRQIRSKRSSLAVDPGRMRRRVRHPPSVTPPDSEEVSTGAGRNDEKKHRLPDRPRRQKLVDEASDATAGVGGSGAGVAATLVFGRWAVVLGPLATPALKKLFKRLGVDRVFAEARSEFVARQLVVLW